MKTETEYFIKRREFMGENPEITRIMEMAATLTLFSVSRWHYEMAEKALEQDNAEAAEFHLGCGSHFCDLVIDAAEDFTNE